MAKVYTYEDMKRDYETLKNNPLEDSYDMARRQLVFLKNLVLLSYKSDDEYEREYSHQIYKKELQDLVSDLEAQGWEVEL